MRQVTDAVKARHQAELEEMIAGRTEAERECDKARQDRDAALQR